MPLKLKRLDAAKTYVILDAQVLPYAKLLSLLPGLVKGGVGIVQLRDKQGFGRSMVEFSRSALKITRNKCLYIVNDRLDVALAAKADGVHVGQDDLTVVDVKRLMPSSMLVGVSCQTLAHAKKAQQDGADYIGFGSVFKTKTKPERQPLALKVLQKVHKEIKIPIFPIGGITRNNVKEILKYGVKRVAVCRDILEAKNPGDVVGWFEGVWLSGCVE